nr:MFS transporter [Kibdelosporangium sp. MJ126-NF4]
MTQLEVRTRRVHWAWWVAGVSFLALIGAAGFRAAPGVLIEPLHQEFGWSRGTISSAVSVNLVLYGVIAPFAAALMERFGMRKIVASALTLVAAGSGLTVFMTSSWQLILFWGVFVGVGTGSMSLAFVATMTSRWFVKRRGLVSGVLTAAGATGQLIFLPLVANMATDIGWRQASLVIAGVALLVVPIIWIFLRDHPSHVGVAAYGADKVEPPPPPNKGAARRALQVLRQSTRSGTFWLLVGGFAICGASTNGLVATHFVPAAHDHGIPMTTAAGLLALVGIFDVVGTIFSGWLTDRVDPRWLLGTYYALRGGSLMLLPGLFGPTIETPMWAFIIFYGLDWVATVPPTLALCRDRFGMSGPIVFGWVFASHQLGAAFAATAAGATRDHTGSYDIAWYAAGLLCLAAALMSLLIRKVKAPSVEVL